MSGRSAIIVLRAEYSRLPRLEHFLDDFTGAPVPQRLRAKIVASELFDNLVAHGSGILPPFIVVGLSAGPPFALTFRYRCTNFEEFVHALEVNQTVDETSAPPRYDATAGLYRGFGLTMCRSVSSSIDVRRGLFWNRVSVVF